MTGKGGTVTVDADLFLQLLDELAELEQRLRSLGLKGFNLSGKFTTSSPARREKKDESEAMPLGLDISDIEWKRSNKQGGGAAGPSDG